MVGVAIMTKATDLISLYRIFDTLEAASGGKRCLAQLAPTASWPRRGVYFFFEPGEVRTGSGHGCRLVRVGTHALGIGALDFASAPAPACRKIVGFRRKSPRINLQTSRRRCSDRARRLPRMPILGSARRHRQGCGGAGRGTSRFGRRRGSGGGCCIRLSGPNVVSVALD